jgi:hypothetical protein
MERWNSLGAARHKESVCRRNLKLRSSSPTNARGRQITTTSSTNRWRCGVQLSGNTCFLAATVRLGMSLASIISAELDRRCKTTIAAPRNLATSGS